jgi:hypothetical protein
MKVPKQWVGAAVIVALIGVYLYYNPPRVYPLPALPEAGLYGKVRGRTLYVLFMRHPQTGELLPIRDYDTLYSNTITLYALTLGDAATVKVTFYSYQLEQQGNTTIKVNEEVRSYDVVIKPRVFIKESLTLPTHMEKTIVEIKVDGYTLFTIYHMTHPQFIEIPKRYTFGTFMADVSVYIIGAAVVIFSSLLASKKVIDKVKVTPKAHPAVGVMLVGYIGFAMYLVIDVMIYTLGVTSATWTYIPIGVVAFIFGLFLIQAPRKKLICTKVMAAERPQKGFREIEYVEKEGCMYVAKITLADFIRGRQRILELKPETETDPKWLWETDQDDVKIASYKEIQEEPDKVTVILQGLHARDVEEVLAEIKSTEDLALEKDEMKRMWLEEVAHRWSLIRLGIRDGVKRILKGIMYGDMGEEYPEPERKEEHQKV